MRQITCPDGRKITEFEYKPNCFVLQSGHKKQGSKIDTGMHNVYVMTSFLYRNEISGYAVEWEVEYGPIQLFKRASEHSPEAKAHLYAWPFIYSNSLDWSQLAVERERLPEKLLQGDYDAIFEVLKNWSIRD